MFQQEWGWRFVVVLWWNNAFSVCQGECNSLGCDSLNSMRVKSAPVDAGRGDGICFPFGAL